MKKILILILFLPSLLQAQSFLSAVIQPTDLGMGARFDHHWKDQGLYSALTKGCYRLFDGTGITHAKISLGAICILPEHKSFISLGLSYHHYNVLRKETFVGDSRTLIPFSVETGTGVRMGKITTAFRLDLIKWGDISIDVGIRITK